MYVGKTKGFVTCAVNAQLIWAFVFAYTKSKFSHDKAQILSAVVDCKTPKITVCLM